MKFGEITFTPAEELLVALLLADEGLGMHQAAEAISEMHPIAETLCFGSDRARRWVLESLNPSVAKRVQRKRDEILVRWPSEPNRKKALVHAAREVRLAKIEARLHELRASFADLGSVDLGSPEVRKVFDEQRQLREQRARLLAPPEVEA